MSKFLTLASLVVLIALGSAAGGCADSDRSRAQPAEQQQPDVARLTADWFLPDGHAGQPYSVSLGPDGGYPPYWFEFVAGQMPDGLALGRLTGVISGIPTTVGPGLEFVVSVSDTTGTVNGKHFEIEILP